MRPEGRFIVNYSIVKYCSVEPTGIEPATVCLQGSPVTLNLDPKKPNLAEEGGLDPQPTHADHTAFETGPSPNRVLLPVAERGGIDPQALSRSSRLPSGPGP